MLVKIFKLSRELSAGIKLSLEDVNPLGLKDGFWLGKENGL
jgi:hypothetical protein